MRRIRFAFGVVLLLCAFLGIIGVLTGEKVMKDGPAFTYIMIPLVLLPVAMAVPFKFWLECVHILACSPRPVMSCVPRNAHWSPLPHALLQ